MYNQPNYLPQETRWAIQNDKNGELAIQIINSLIGQHKDDTTAKINAYTNAFVNGQKSFDITAVQNESGRKDVRIKWLEDQLEALQAYAGTTAEELMEYGEEVDELNTQIESYQQRDAMQRLMAEELAMSLSIFSRAMTRGVEIFGTVSDYDASKLQKRKWLEAAKNIADTYEARRLSVVDLLNALYGEKPELNSDYRPLETALNG